MATVDSMETGKGLINGGVHSTADTSMDIEYETEIPTKSREELAEMKKVEGNKLYTQQNYDGAIRLYTEAIELQPKQAKYYGNRSAAFMMLNRFTEALNDARMTIKLDENFIKGHYRCGKCHLALGSVRNAITCFQKVLEKEPKNRDAQNDLRTAKMVQDFENSAFDAYKKEDFRKVAYCMNRIMDFCPDCNTYRVMKAEALALQGKYVEAQIEANEILRKDNSNSDAIYVRGLCLYYQDNVDRAYEHFSQVLRKDPDHTKARLVYKKAKSLHAKKASGNEAFTKGRYDEAQSIYSEALEIDPLNKNTNAKLYYNRALVDAKLKQMDSAIEDCTKAIELDSSYLKAYLKRAKCYMDTEQYEEAVRDYEKICKMDRSREYKQLLQDAKLELKKSKRKDYYKILGISKSATDDEVKKAYRKEALKHHPDRHSSATEEERKKEEILFKEVNEAYSVLSDPKKRSRYDSGQDLDDMGFGGGDFDPDMIFQQFFGGGSGGPGFVFNMGNMGGGQGGGYPGGFKFTFG